MEVITKWNLDFTCMKISDERTTFFHNTGNTFNTLFEKKNSSIGQIDINKILCKSFI